MRIRAAAALMFWILAAHQAEAQDALPEEFKTLVAAYSKGRLSVDQLRGVCKWSDASGRVSEQLSYARRQNIDFCEGFLAGTREFAALDSDVLSTVASTGAPSAAWRCQGGPTTSLRGPLMAREKLPSASAQGSPALFNDVLGCKP